MAERLEVGHEGEESRVMGRGAYYYLENISEVR